MRITLNLASKPFIELRPLYARLRWLMAILLLVAIPLWFVLRTEQRKAALANAKLHAVKDSIQRLEDQQRSYQALMRQPQNAAVLTQAAFLNQLYAQKAFSWTAVMMDLETVLPAGVQVMNIDPEIDAKSGHVTIRLRVNGQRDRAVELVRNLEHSRRFLQPRLASESLETTTTGNQANFQAANGPTNVNFDVLAEYNPLSEREAAKTAKDAQGSADSTTAKPQTGPATPGPAARRKHATPPAPMAPARPRPAPKGAQ
jgi:type IV pilus assembly protein PilN